ncbi:MAG: hypothetical protein KIT84_12150 [Labilithrix sp.]|nr:hypothetical protein [Labilithrix sp.]MCW5811764.1 hypothetical protein [Labilithrix sp.]
MNTKRFYGAALMGAILVPVALTACGDGEDNPLCCNEFKAGATISANIGGSAESQVAVQAVADFAGIASAALDDISSACKAMASDLDAPAATLDAAEKETDKQKRMQAYCAAAVSAIGSVKAKASGTLTVDFVPPKCEASLSAKANCQAKCSASGSCDIKATPPTCEGGSLEVSCKGSCEAKAGAKLNCTGSCSATCTGKCTAEGGVQCAGECNGTCEGNTANGAASGKCEGTCKGTCSATAPNVTCEGSCEGECGGSCTGSAEASVKCDGECKADYEPLSCKGGELKGGCQVEAKCDANCDASVSAKANCSPPSVTVAFAGAADVQAAGKLRATLEANFGIILAFRARLEGMVKVTTSFSANVTAVTDIKAACIPPVVAAVGTALADAQAAASATVSVAGSVTGG